ncbi:hypothetical protein D9M68_576540 [compost metagenome]
MQQILVVTAQNLQIRALATNHGDLGVPAAHVAHAVLHREYAGLRRDVKLGLQVVGALGCIGVLEQDQRQPTGLKHLAVLVLRCALLVAEAQPAVRGVEQAGGRARLDRALGFLGGHLGAFQRDAGDDGNGAIDCLDEGFDDLHLLRLRQKGAFASVAEHGQALHAIDAAEPGAQLLAGGVVHRAVAGEGRNRGRIEAAEVDIFHVTSCMSMGFTGCRMLCPESLPLLVSP